MILVLSPCNFFLQSNAGRQHLVVGLTDFDTGGTSGTILLYKLSIFFHQSVLIYSNIHELTDITQFAASYDLIIFPFSF